MLEKLAGHTEAVGLASLYMGGKEDRRKKKWSKADSGKGLQ